LTNQVLTQLPPGNLTDVTVTFPAPLSGLDSVAGIPYLLMGDQGQVPFFIFSPAMTQAPIPALTGEFASGSYEFWVMATPDADTSVPLSASFLRSVNIGNTIQVPAWLALPTALSENSGVFQYAPVAGADLHSVVFQDANTHAAWTVVLLDNRTSFSLPTLTPDPRPAGQVTMVVTAMVLPGFNPQDFRTADQAHTLTQTSLQSVTFAH
jgi:hypothetical protein